MRSGATILAAVTVLAVAALTYVAFGSRDSGPGAGSGAGTPAKLGSEPVTPTERSDPPIPGTTDENYDRSGGAIAIRDPSHHFADLLRSFGGKRAIVGTVLDATERGVRAAPVWLLHPEDDDDVDRRTTDDEGRFAFPLDLDDEGFATLRVVAHDPTAGLTPIETIDLSGEKRVFEVTLRGRDALGAIDGRVLGRDGQPLDAHTVQVARVDDFDSEHPEWRAGADSAEVRTDMEGRYVVRGLRPGRYEVNAVPTENVAASAWSPDEPAALAEIETGTPAVELKIAHHVRVDITPVSIDGMPRAMERIALIVFGGPAAAEVSARFRGGLPWNVPEYPPTSELFEPGPRYVASFWVPAEHFVVARCESMGSQDVAGVWIDGRSGIQRVPVTPAPIAPGTIHWSCLGADGRPVAPVFLRISEASGRLVLPAASVDLGGGFFELPQGQSFEVPAGRYSYEARASALRTTDGVRVGDYLPATGELAVGPDSRVELALSVDAAVTLEFLVTAAPTKRSTSDTRWFAGEVLGQHVLRAYAGAQPAGSDDPVTLLLSLEGDGPDALRREVAGLPWRPGETLRVLATGTLAPGDASLWCTSWRVAPEDEPRALWPVRLLPGLNRFRLSVDAELVVHFLGR